MFYAKHRSRRKKMKFVKGIAMLLCLVTIFTSVWVGNLGIGAEDGDRSETVKITVNYVYKSNNAMVAQPYTAQIEKGASFKKTLEVPKLFNYSIPNDEAIGLDTDSIVLTKDEATGKYSLAFDLQSVNKNIDVTLYYVAGTAKYTVYHYYQNLENDEYASDPTVVELTGDIDAYTQAVADNKPGYHCKGVPQTTIAADGTTKVEIFYDRDYYTVIFDVNGGIDGPEPIRAKYGTTFEANAITKPTRKGFNFLGWSPALSDTVTITGNVTYVAQWKPEKGQADYTIVLWGQNANDDQYSYLGSHEAWGNVDKEVTWNEGTLISHVHTDDCWQLTCTKEQHTHSEACLNCGKQEHTHTSACCSLEEYSHIWSCYPNTTSTVKSFWFEDSNPKQGQVYRSVLGLGGNGIYIGDKWYEYTGSASSDSIVSPICGKTEHSHGATCNHDKCGLEAHSHGATCIGCGKTEHTHDNSCVTLICGLSDTPKKYMSNIKPDSKLWKFVRSDTVTVGADGRTVLNVYFDRTEFTLTFKYGRNSGTTETITDRWGANVKARFDAIELKAKEYSEKLLGWEDSTTGYYTNNVMIMPQTDKTFTAEYSSQYSTQYTMSYYAADLNGQYQKIFDITFYGGNTTVTADEYYEWEGFRINKEKSTQIGGSCEDAKFYYDRNDFALEFFSADNSKAERTERPLYQQPLGKYSDYIPVNKPTTVEPDAVFVGWYLNPECTGEEYDISAHTMPANNIALYAKWVNGLYTVRTYTDESKSELYKYEGYEGVQTNIVKYTLAEAPKDPDKSGYVFAGWFYNDGEKEEPFSFTMPITRNYNLYPKFTDQVMVNYTVHYYIENSTTKVADDDVGQARIGSSVTIKAKMGTELYSGMQNNFFPNLTSTSVTIEKDNQEIIIYYKAAQEVEYTVKYQDKNGKDLIPSVKKKTKDAIVTEKYVPIPNYAPRQDSIRFELKAEGNVIVFIYDPTLTTLNIRKTGFDAADAGTTFIFRIKGTDENTKNIDLRVTIHCDLVTNVTVADLPVGSYTVTEESDWSWRYQPKNGEQTQTITLDPDVTKNVLTFENERKDGQWLSGDAYNNNLYKPDSN